MSEIRIIAGQYRRRKITVIDAEDLRPTADRGRETLFNWLQNDIINAVCLDAFAGSGALGFEACSRGAKQVFLIEQQLTVFQQLQKNQSLLNCTNAELIHADATAWLRQKSLQQPLPLQQPLRQQPLRFDIIFLDPPFRHSPLLTHMLGLLATQDTLTANGLAYLEMPTDSSSQNLPDEWLQYATRIKQQRIGQSFLELWRKQTVAKHNEA
jgi:16S rRNA (guanine966-N2)-methyltransferase